MSYRKLSLWLVISLVLLLLISLSLICIWGYSYFYAKDDTVRPALAAASTQTAERRDSLRQLYNTTIDRLDTPLDSVWKHPDSASAKADPRLEEFYRLRAEIDTLLRKNTDSHALDSARLKIALLQQTIEELRNRTLVVESENKKLTELVRQLSSRVRQDGGTSSAPAARSYAGRISQSSDGAALAAAFTASDLRISAQTDGEQETTEAQHTDQIAGSFTIRSNEVRTGSEEVYIVVIKPDGRVLQGSSWESGAFDTREGRKLYSAKLRFDYNKGETRRLNFSVGADDLSKGNYTVQVYHNGMMIARTNKSLL